MEEDSQKVDLSQAKPIKLQDLIKRSKIEPQSYKISSFRKHNLTAEGSRPESSTTKLKSREDIYFEGALLRSVVPPFTQDQPIKNLILAQQDYLSVYSITQDQISLYHKEVITSEEILAKFINPKSRGALILMFDPTTTTLHVIKKYRYTVNDLLIIQFASNETHRGKIEIKFEVIQLEARLHPNNGSFVPTEIQPFLANSNTEKKGRGREPTFYFVEFYFQEILRIVKVQHSSSLAGSQKVKIKSRTIIDLNNIFSKLVERAMEKCPSEGSLMNFEAQSVIKLNYKGSQSFLVLEAPKALYIILLDLARKKVLMSTIIQPEDLLAHPIISQKLTEKSIVSSMLNLVDYDEKFGTNHAYLNLVVGYNNKEEASHFLANNTLIFTVKIEEIFKREKASEWTVVEEGERGPNVIKYQIYDSEKLVSRATTFEERDMKRGTLSWRSTSDLSQKFMKNFSRHPDSFKFLNQDFYAWEVDKLTESRFLLTDLRLAMIYDHENESIVDLLEYSLFSTRGKIKILGGGFVFMIEHEEVTILELDPSRTSYKLRNQISIRKFLPNMMSSSTTADGFICEFQGTKEKAIFLTRLNLRSAEEGRERGNMNMNQNSVLLLVLDQKMSLKSSSQSTEFNLIPSIVGTEHNLANLGEHLITLAKTSYSDEQGEFSYLTLFDKSLKILDSIKVQNPMLAKLVKTSEESIILKTENLDPETNRRYFYSHRFRVDVKINKISYIGPLCLELFSCTVIGRLSLSQPNQKLYLPMYEIESSKIEIINLLVFDQQFRLVDVIDFQYDEESKPFIYTLTFLIPRSTFGDLILISPVPSGDQNRGYRFQLFNFGERRVSESVVASKNFFEDEEGRALFGVALEDGALVLSKIKRD